MWRFSLLILLVALCLPLSVHGVEDPLIIDPVMQYIDIQEGYGGRYATVTVTNVSDAERTVTMAWDRYVELSPNEIRAPEEWFVRFSEPMLLPPGVPTVLNMTIEVPVDTPQDKYKAYIVIGDDTGYARHMTMWIRLGTAVPRYEFSLTKAKFNMTLNEPGIGIGSLTALGIKNTGNENATFELMGRIPTEGADPEYTVAPYTVIDDERVKYDWITIGTPTISVESQKIGFPSVSIRIPSDVVKGKYVAWVGVRCLDDTGHLINIGYAAKLLMDINREPTKESGARIPWVAIGIGGAVLVGFVGYQIKKKVAGDI